MPVTLHSYRKDLPQQVVKLIETLLNELEEIFKDQFLGMYINGSLAMDDFQPDRSDIDLVVTTKELLSGKLLEEIKLMHNKIYNSGILYSQRYGSIYIPLNFLENYIEDKAFFPCFNDGGTFTTNGFGVIENHMLYEHGIIVKGLPPKSFMKPVSSDELKKAAIRVLNNWWKPQLTDHSRLIKDDYQVYAVLTMCRVLYTINSGKVVSKSKAAKYAKMVVDEKLQKLIDDALLWKIGEGFNKLDKVLEFIKFTLNKTSLYEN